jgi:hypothetical protein
MRYNKPGTPYYKAAQRIKSNSSTLLAELDRLRTSASSKLIDEKDVADSPVQRNILPIGDLEPPLAMLDLLTSLDIADELDIVLHSDPLQFLLAYELPVARPLAPVPPAPLRRKTKRVRKVELAKRRTEQRGNTAAKLTAEAASEIVDASIGSRARTPTCPPTNLAAVADTDPRGTTSTAAAFTSIRLADGLETEQVLGKRKRAKPASSQPGTDAGVLTDINPKDSFTLFDQGWILDPGVRRGGRSRIERLPPALPKKRPKGACAPRVFVGCAEEATLLRAVSSLKSRCNRNLHGRKCLDRSSPVNGLFFFPCCRTECWVRYTKLLRPYHRGLPQYGQPRPP